MPELEHVVDLNGYTAAIAELQSEIEAYGSLRGDLEKVAAALNGILHSHNRELRELGVLHDQAAELLERNDLQQAVDAIGALGTQLAQVRYGIAAQIDRHTPRLEELQGNFTKLRELHETEGREIRAAISGLDRRIEASSTSFATELESQKESLVRAMEIRTTRTDRQMDAHVDGLQNHQDTHAQRLASKLNAQLAELQSGIETQTETLKASLDLWTTTIEEELDVSMTELEAIRSNQIILMTLMAFVLIAAIAIAFGVFL